LVLAWAGPVLAVEDSVSVAADLALAVEDWVLVAALGSARVMPRRHRRID
jgi:hypothetical protein